MKPLLVVRPLKRWRVADVMVADDLRPGAERVEQRHSEELAILSACTQPQDQSLPSSQIVPSLADKGLSLAAECLFYRVLKKHQQHNYRERMKPPRKVPEPNSFTATGPN
jgi:putative transposase